MTNKIEALKGKKTYLFVILFAVYCIGLIAGVFTPDSLDEVQRQAADVQNQIEGVKGIIEALIAAALRAGVAKVQ